jgi:hypothetical protein
MSGIGFGVYGSGIRFWGLGFGVEELVTIDGLGFRVQGSEFRA